MESTDITQRDFVGDMRDLIDKMTDTAGAPYNSRVVAAQIVEHLRIADPDLLDGWLYTQATDFVWRVINDIDRSKRSRLRLVSRAAAFAADSAAYEAGETGRMVDWLNAPFTIKGGDRIRLAEMYRSDVESVADLYRGRARDNAMTAAFLRVVARKLGNHKVSDVFSNEALTTIWRRLAGEPTVGDEGADDDVTILASSTRPASD